MALISGLKLLGNWLMPMVSASFARAAWGVTARASAAAIRATVARAVARIPRIGGPLQFRNVVNPPFVACSRHAETPDLRGSGMRRGDIGPDDNASTSAIHSQLKACGAGIDRRGWLRARIAIDSD